MKKIYKIKSDKEMAKVLRKFLKSQYGKTVFVLAYAIPFFLFLITLRFIFKGYPFISGFALLTLVSFIVGSAYFYKEIRIFINK